MIYGMLRACELGPCCCCGRVRVVRVVYVGACMSFVLYYELSLIHLSLVPYCTVTKTLCVWRYAGGWV